MPHHPSKKETTLGLIQMSMKSDPGHNLEKACAFIVDAHKQGAKIVCLPELFKSLYFCQAERHEYFGLAEELSTSETTHRLMRLSADLDIVLIASLFEKRTEGLYHNTTAIWDQGRLLGHYRKMHIPDDPLFYEKFYFTPGDTGFRSFETTQGKLGILICWDQWYPEAARATSLMGANILFYPTAIGWHPSEKSKYGEDQLDAWITIQRSHAIANGLFVASCNRTGLETPEGGEGLEFWGNSFICGPDGKILQRWDDKKEGALIQTVSLSHLDIQRTHWPFLRDRRIDAYQPLLHRWLDDK